MTDFCGYLDNFFKEFHYDEEDATYFISLIKKIYETPSVADVFDEAERIYQENIHFTYNQMSEIGARITKETGIHPYTADFLVYLALIPYSEKLAKEKNIPRELWASTGKDLRYKLVECKAVKGIRGSFVSFWFPGFFNFTRFQFGRLQFEIEKIDRDLNFSGHSIKVNDPVINVHIPRDGTPLTKEACDKAFSDARKYFYNEVGSAPFVCHSWTLFPKQVDFLPKNSNLRSFMDRFHIYDWGYNPMFFDMWRLFDTDEQNPERLPTNGSLRAAYVSYLKEGNLPGWGAGIYFPNDNT